MRLYALERVAPKGVAFWAGFTFTFNHEVNYED